MSISVVVIAKDAAYTIEQTLRSVQFADEVILVDIRSSDQTKEIAKKYCSKTLDYKEDCRFVEPVRQFALEQTTKDWSLVLDADEEIPSTLAEKLQNIDHQDLGDIFCIAHKNIVSHYWMQHTGWWPDYQLRFFKKDLVTWGDKIHAQPIIKDGYKSQNLEATEELAILHHNYRDTADYLSRFARYTDIEAEQKTPNDPEDFQISASTLLNAFKDDWLRRFFAKQGYKDGVRGFYLSLTQAVYQMTVQMKIFDRLDNQVELEKNDQQQLIRDLRAFHKEFNFWLTDLEIQESTGLKKFSLMLRKKINL